MVIFKSYRFMYKQQKSQERLLETSKQKTYQPILTTEQGILAQMQFICQPKLYVILYFMPQYLLHEKHCIYYKWKSMYKYRFEFRV